MDGLAMKFARVSPGFVLSLHTLSPVAFRAPPWATVR